MKKSSIYSLAKKLAIEYNSNPYTLLKEYDITLKLDDLQEFAGCCIHINNKKLIIVNNKLNKLKKYFVIAHEIGHILMHENSTFFMKFFPDMYSVETKLESEANYFATIFLSESELLFDEDEEIMQIIENYRS